jgi:hypothetical protein
VSVESLIDELRDLYERESGRGTVEGSLVLEATAQDETLEPLVLEAVAHDEAQGPLVAVQPQPAGTQRRRARQRTGFCSGKYTGTISARVPKNPGPLAYPEIHAALGLSRRVIPGASHMPDRMPAIHAR